jgi:hypothetical protein
MWSVCFIHSWLRLFEYCFLSASVSEINLLISYGVNNFAANSNTFSSCASISCVCSELCMLRKNELVYWLPDDRIESVKFKWGHLLVIAFCCTRVTTRLLS